MTLPATAAHFLVIWQDDDDLSPAVALVPHEQIPAAIQRIGVETCDYDEDLAMEDFLTEVFAGNERTGRAFAEDLRGYDGARSLHFSSCSAAPSISILPVPEAGTASWTWDDSAGRMRSFSIHNLPAAQDVHAAH